MGSPHWLAGSQWELEKRRRLPSSLSLYWKIIFFFFSTVCARDPFPSCWFGFLFARARRSSFVFFCCRLVGRHKSVALASPPSTAGQIQSSCSSSSALPLRRFSVNCVFLMICKTEKIMKKWENNIVKETKKQNDSVSLSITIGNLT